MIYFNLCVWLCVSVYLSFAVCGGVGEVAQRMGRDLVLRSFHGLLSQCDEILLASGEGCEVDSWFCGRCLRERRGGIDPC